MSPVKMSLEANKEYHFCTCGKSANTVLCDGSHKGSGLAPKTFFVPESKEYSLCACKKSANAPFCDGSHAQ